ncbi:MAG: Bug family tripartite tricarboxylate transporter substrate binding protein, partial [Gammaproteobacteria bacterium]
LSTRLVRAYERRLSGLPDATRRALLLVAVAGSADDAVAEALAEQGLAGYDSSVFFGVVVPAGTPKPVVARLNGAFRAALNDPAVKEVLLKQGLEPAASQTPEAFGSFLGSEVAKWAEVVKASGAQVD